MTINMFEVAARKKIRFDSPKGLLTVEDLFDLPLTSNTGKANLDSIAKELFKQLKNDDSVSFVTPAQKSDETVQLKFDIVKHIIDVRVAARNAAADAAKLAAQKQVVMEVIAKKENEALANMPVEELRKLLETM